MRDVWKQGKPSDVLKANCPRTVSLKFISFKTIDKLGLERPSKIWQSASNESSVSNLLLCKSLTATL